MNSGPVRWRQAVWWLAPAAFSLVYLWPTLGMWFRADDFAWLGLRLSIATPADLIRALFLPMAQGTVRFLSERAFFLTLETLFGLDALPFRIVVLAAQVGSSVLLAGITKRLTGSLGAAVAAPILWTISVGLAAAIGWLSSANQVFLALFVLGSFAAFLTQRRGWSWGMYLAGFGILESMIVLPGVLLAYASCFDRTRMREAAGYSVPALAFALLHALVIPKTKTDPAYQMYWDPASVTETLRTYWSWAATPGMMAAVLAIVLVTVCLIEISRGDRPVLFGLIWFALLLAPVLPLREHRLHYYLGAPGIALAYTLGAAGAAAGRWHRFGWGAALAVYVAYGLGQVPASRQTLAWNREKSHAVRTLVRGVEAAHRLHPGDALLLAGISNTLFWDGIFDNPFRLLGIDRVYLAPGAEQAIDQHPEWGGINNWVIPPSAARELFENERVEVYTPRQGTLVNVTAEWRPRAHLLGDELAGFVDLGDPAFNRQLKSGWEDLFDRSRWMGREAAVELSTLRVTAGELVVSAWCPKDLASGAPVEVEAWAAGVALGRQTVPAREALFDLIFPLPAAVRGHPRVEVRLRASRTFRPPEDGRDLSFVFGSIQVR